MTKEEILNMPAGREMDILIAEDVMGWTSIREEKYQGESVIGGCPPGETSLSFVPFYSAGIAAAWEVVEKLNEWSLWIDLANSPDGFQVGFAEHFTFADTAPLAICRAALLATLGDND